MITAAIIGGSAILASSLIGAVANKRNADRANEFNTEQIDKMNEYNSPLNQRLRSAQAGLNSRGSANEFTSLQQETAQYQVPDIATPITQGMTNLSNMAQAYALNAESIKHQKIENKYLDTLYNQQIDMSASQIFGMRTANSRLLISLSNEYQEHVAQNGEITDIEGNNVNPNVTPFHPQKENYDEKNPFTSYNMKLKELDAKMQGYVSAIEANRLSALMSSTEFSLLSSDKQNLIVKQYNVASKQADYSLGALDFAIKTQAYEQWLHLIGDSVELVGDAISSVTGLGRAVKVFKSIGKKEGG